MSITRAKVVVAATGKGGAGKSTVVACLAGYWNHRHRKVGLLDCDPNQTLARWHAKGGDLSALPLRVQFDEHEVIPTIAEMSASLDVLLVDCAGFGNQAMIFAIGAADLVLIPAMPDEASVFEAIKTRRTVESAAQLTRRSIPARAVLCRVKRSAVSRHAHAQLAAFHCAPLAAQVVDRVSYQEATFRGASPTALAPSGPAAKDIATLAREIEALLWT